MLRFQMAYIRKAENTRGISHEMIPRVKKVVYQQIPGIKLRRRFGIDASKLRSYIARLDIHTQPLYDRVTHLCDRCEPRGTK